MKFFLLTFCILLTSCASVRDDDSTQKTEPFVGVRDGNLIYEGTISEASNNAVFASFMGAEIKPNRLLITSNGGPIGAGMDLGRWVKDNKLDVEVVGACASSCANYVFPAGTTKYLRKDSVLMWHGSAWQSAFDNDENIYPKREKETNFFADLGVDNLLCTYGQSRINFWDWVKNVFGKGPEGYDYSLADMERFGLSNIVLTDGEWEWRKHRPKSAGWVKRIKVDKDFELKLRRFEI